MSSLVRRIQRQQYPSQKVHFKKDKDGNRVGPLFANNPREKFYQRRGSMLGVKNPRCKALKARLARDAKWGRVS